MSKEKETVLVVGATGRFGSLAVPVLAGEGLRVRVLVRSTAKAKAALKAGAHEVVHGDLRDAASLAAGAAGASGVYYMSPALAEGQAELGLGLLRAAQRAGVRRFVFSSSIRALDDPAAKRAVESALYESGLQYTLLRPASFMQNLLDLWPAVRRSGVLAAPFDPLARIARVDYRDVAEVAAIALGSDRLAHASLELCAPGAYNRHEVAALMSQFLGRPVYAGQQDAAAWAAQAGLPYDARQLAQAQRAFDYLGRQGLPGNALALRAVLGREPRSLGDFIAEMAGVGKAPRRRGAATRGSRVRGPSLACWGDVS
ncbi:SDR family oxidoreductase [Bordetella trematum]|uniref:SDR family oxidoreductase n=1 Tax=Bordetella trematum TaxID=123899 RepID=UPI000470D0C4|nr:NmrA family NAD(P)-binding protein [Bordetella trematum]